MKKCSLILCEKKMSPKSKKSLSSAEIVFKPMWEILKTSLLKAGINDIFFLFEKEERTEKLRNFILQNKNSDIFIAEGTTPFISKQTIEKSYEAFLKNGRKTTAVVSDFCDSFSALWVKVSDLKKHCAFEKDEEISLNDIAGDFDRINEFISRKNEDFLKSENLYEASQLSEYKRRKILEKLMLSGVEIPCTQGVVISEDAEIESGVKIHPSTIIMGENKIFCGAQIGPFARIRPGCVIGKNAKVGNFVELKNAFVEENAKISHLSYIGDSFVGKEVNIGCGCATVNFDGRNKNKTIIEDGAFIGCGVNLVAPVKIGKDAFVAAGSTVTEEVEANSLSIARARQVNKEDWVLKKKPYKRMK
ncbi:MAG: hypothetical protein E7536_05640 [Ruminococcaceae bacterium]|nr:hypothetical protein [Oscillospiraceae bacterium]